MFKTLVKKEFGESLYENKGIWMIFGSSVLLSALCLIVCNIKEGSVLSQSDLLQYAIKASFLIMLMVTSVLASSSFVSEREENTLESLLLTPASNTALALAKYIAVIGIGLISTVIAVPYIFAISLNSGTVLSSVLILIICGFLMLVAFSALSMILSIKMKNSKASVLISMLIIAVMTMPAMAKGILQLSAIGTFLLKINPVVGCFDFMSKVLTDKMSFVSQIGYLLPALIFALLSVGAMVLSSKSIRLKGEK